MEARKEEGFTVYMSLREPLPCTIDGCNNRALAAIAFYSAAINGWNMFPLCRTCTRKRKSSYEFLGPHGDGEDWTSIQKGGAWNP
jgi:hypothetical protein